MGVLGPLAQLQQPQKPLAAGDWLRQSLARMAQRQSSPAAGLLRVRGEAHRDNPSCAVEVMGRGAFVAHNTANYPAMQVLRGWPPAALFHSANPARRVVWPRRGSPVAPSVHLGTLTPVIGRERFEPSRRRGRSELDGFGFGRRPHSGPVGRDSSPASRHRPSSSVSTSSRPASSRRRSPTVDRLILTAAANLTALRPGASRSASRSRSSVFAAVDDRPWRVLPTCGAGRWG